MELSKLAWTEVDSSNVNAVAHDNEKNLYVKYKGGSVYEYKGADHTVYLNMLGAKSVGKYLNDFVKPYYPYELKQIG